MSDRPEDLTTMHVGRALGGDESSLGWLVDRLSPALYLQARYRLKGPLASWCDPADLVQEVWAITLPRLPDLVARDGRMTPVLVKFLSSTLLLRVNRMLEDYIREGRPRRDASMSPGGVGPSSGGAPQEFTGRSQDGVSQAVERSEVRLAVRDAIDELSEGDRDVVVLRGIEQLSNNKVAEILGIQPSAVTMRYQKALERLRSKLPQSVFEDLAGE